ncbi:OmpW/AlkL family protein [Endozoicomonas numazuensis]|uniref:Membrane protein n=1 Tax=Endozoicomonas numazuensis TaxID=1137799 RepID=A0A081NIF7_9GAMM|nr:OmpW family outer membrane protein [Endozoicomonas numazuensis]KEQ18230.1 membrane protein [Endozoicomonas numazuensis]
MNRNVLSLAIAAAVAVSATSAQAYEAGDFIFRGGIASVQTDVDSGGLKTNGVEDKNATVDVDNDTQLGLSFTYMLSDKFGVELLAATPFQHTLTGKGNLAALGDIAEVKHLPPTVSLQYYPMDKNSKFQPYLGLGLNYTVFFSEDFKGAAGDSFRDLELDSSMGLSGQLGFDYRLNENWAINAAVWYMDINTTAKFKDSDGNRYKLDAELDPLVYMAGVSYKF